MSEVGAWLEELRGEGRLESTGTFTLNPRVARRKMRIYQLAEPHHYALLLIAGCLGRGATSIEVESGPADCVVRALGTGLTREEADRLLPSLFSSPAGREARKLRLLAFALNGAMGLAPLRVQLRSREGVGIVLTGSRESVTTKAGGSEPGLSIRVQGRLNWKVFRRRELGPEGAAVLARCGWVPADVRVNGRPVERKRLLPCVAVLSLSSGDPEAALVGPGRRSAVTLTRTTDRPVSLLLGLPSRPLDEPRLHLVRWGVEVSVRPCPELPIPVQAVVNCPDLRLNVSQSDVVEDSVYRSLVELVNRELLALLEALAGGFGQLEDSARETARGYLLRFLQAGVEVPASVLQAGLLRQADGSPVSLAALQTDYRRRGCLHVTRRHWEVLPLGGVPALWLDEMSEPLVASWFGRRVPAEPLLEEALAALARRRRWERRAPQAPTVSRACRIRLPLEGFEGELGLERSSLPGWEIAYYKRRRLLAVQSYPEDHPEHGGRFPTGLRVAVNHDGLEPTETWDDVKGPAIAELFSTIHHCLPYLYERLGETSPFLPAYREYLRRLESFSDRVDAVEPTALNRLRSTCLASVTLPEVRGRLGLSESSRPGEVLLYRGPHRPPDRLRLEQPLPPGVTGLALDEEGCAEAVARALPELYAEYLAEVGGAGLNRLLDLLSLGPRELPHRLKTLPLFPSASGEPLSLGEIEALVQERGWAGYLRRPPRRATSEPPFLVLEPAQARRLESWFGPASLRPDPDGYRRELERGRFLSRRPLRPPLVHGRHRRALEHLQGEIALADLGGPELCLRILYQGRVLVEHQLRTGLTPLEVAVEGSHLTPRSDWGDVVDDDAYQLFREEVYDEVKAYSLALSAPRT